MPPQWTYPGVYIEEVPSGSRLIRGVPTSLTAFVGWTPQGPTDRAVAVRSWSDYTRTYGDLHSDSTLAYAVSHYFANGGREATIVRTASGDDGTPLLPDTPAFWHVLFPTNLPEGAQGATGGIYLLNGVAAFNLLCVPGLTNPSVQGQVASFCHQRRAFYIADAPDTSGVQSIEPVAGSGAMNAAIYSPWLVTTDPMRPTTPRSVPPSGAVAGVYARTEVWKAPAGSQATISGAHGPSRGMTETEAGNLNVRGINTIRTFPTLGTVIWGARTCEGADIRASEWKYVPVRRTALFIGNSLEHGLGWAVFEPNNETLWARIRLQVGAFMYDLFRDSAFQGASPKDAFFVKCDQETTTQPDVDQGIVNVLVGFAPLKPAEFVILSLRQAAGRAQ